MLKLQAILDHLQQQQDEEIMLLRNEIRQIGESIEREDGSFAKIIGNNHVRIHLEGIINESNMDKS